MYPDEALVFVPVEKSLKTGSPESGSIASGFGVVRRAGYRRLPSTQSLEPVMGAGCKCLDEVYLEADLRVSESVRVVAACGVVSSVVLDCGCMWHGDNAASSARTGRSRVVKSAHVVFVAGASHDDESHTSGVGGQQRENSCGYPHPRGAADTVHLRWV